MSISAVAFDVFGTLVQLEDPWLRRVARGWGVNRQRWAQALRRLALCRSYPSREAFAAALALFLRGRADHALARDIAAAVQRQMEAAKLVPGVLSTLAFLAHRGVRLAIISNLSSAHLELLRGWPIMPLLDVAVCSCEVGVAKPDPAIFAELARRLGLPPSEILVVGDARAADVAGATAAGMPVIEVGTRHVPTASLVGWLPLAGDAPLVPLLAAGMELGLPGGRCRVGRVEPLADAGQGRYNLIAAVELEGALEGERWFAKRFADPAGAYVELEARGVVRRLGLAAPEAVIVDGVEPLLLSRAAPGQPLAGAMDPAVAWQLGGHMAFAYVFANADIRPRNAFLARRPGGEVVLSLIDLEHCFLNLALPTETLAHPHDPVWLSRISLEEAEGRAVRRVLTPKTVLRARTEFFRLEEVSSKVTAALADGFLATWERLRRQGEEIFAHLERRLMEEPFLIVGTRRFRRALARFDVEDMRRRLDRPAEEVLGWMLTPCEHGA